MVVFFSLQKKTPSFDHGVVEGFLLNNEMFLFWEFELFLKSLVIYMFLLMEEPVLLGFVNL